MKIIRQCYSEGLKKEEVNVRLEESGFPITITIEDDKSTSLVSINHELTDMKKLISFLVQQNEQTRMQFNKIKDQNQQLIHEIHQLREIMKNEAKEKLKKSIF